MQKKWLTVGFAICALCAASYLFIKFEQPPKAKSLEDATGEGAQVVSTEVTPLTAISVGKDLSSELSQPKQGSSLREPVATDAAAVETLLHSSAKNPSENRDLSKNAKTVNDEEVQKIRHETKVLVASIYGAQREFFLKHGRYTTDLKITGWSPDVRLNSERVGFLTPYFPKKILEGENPKFMSTDDYLQLEERERGSKREYADPAQGISLEKLRKYCQAGCTASSNHFEVIGAANLDADPELDVWLINNKKQIVQLVDDLKE